MSGSNPIKISAKRSWAPWMPTYPIGQEKSDQILTQSDTLLLDSSFWHHDVCLNEESSSFEIVEIGHMQPDQSNLPTLNPMLSNP